MIPLLIKSKGKYYKVNVTDEEVKDFNFATVIGLNGIFQYNKNSAYDVKAPLESCKEIDEIKENVEYFFPPITLDVFEDCLNYCRKVYDKTQGEACALLTLNRKIPLKGQKYKIHIPKQTVSSGSVKYKLEEIYAEFEDGEFLAGSIHSHPGFSAFQSGTDLNDEQNFDGPHVTVGYIKRDNPEIHSRICLAGTSYAPKQLSDILSITPEFKEKEVPKEWVDRAEKESYGTRNTYQHNYPVHHHNGSQYYGSGHCGNYYPKQESLFKWKKADDLFKILKPEKPINQKSSNCLKFIDLPLDLITPNYIGD